jgi:thymidylate synthase (FAD)
MDKLFRVEVVAQTDCPSRAIWYGQHQCVAECFALDDHAPETEQDCGVAIVNHLLPHGHWSPLEHATITLNFGGFSHRIMQQFTRSRIGVSPSVQSFRYTGKRVAELGKAIIEWMEYPMDNPDDEKFWNSAGVWLDVPENRAWVERIFYLRPTGHYHDRFGASIDYDSLARWDDLLDCLYDAYRYATKTANGMPAEMAAGTLPMDARQDWVATFNARSLCAFFDRRTPKDAQLEIRQMCDLIWPHFEAWLPETATWYRKNRWGKNKLAP